MAAAPPPGSLAAFRERITRALAAYFEDEFTGPVVVRVKILTGERFRLIVYPPAAHAPAPAQPARAAPAQPAHAPSKAFQDLTAKRLADNAAADSSPPA